MSDDDDREIPDSELSWGRSPDAMKSAELRERLVAEWSGSSEKDAWARKPKRRWRR
jgi:hypothetical protein